MASDYTGMIERKYKADNEVFYLSEERKKRKTPCCVLMVPLAIQRGKSTNKTLLHWSIL